MKKLLFIISFVIGATGFSQSIEIHFEGVHTPSPEATIEGDIGVEYYSKGYYLLNISGAELSLNWSRHDLASDDCLSDFVCTDDGCYLPYVGDSVIFDSPEPVNVAAGDSVYFVVFGRSSEVACCANYRYYIYNETGDVQDSIDINYRIGGGDCFLGAEEESIFESIAYPNPASDVFNVLVKGTETAITQFILFNVLGEELTNFTLTTGLNELNLNSYPDGIYFYSIKQGNELIETKRLIIRH